MTVTLRGQGPAVITLDEGKAPSGEALLLGRKLEAGGEPRELDLAQWESLVGTLSMAGAECRRLMRRNRDDLGEQEARAAMACAVNILTTR